MIYLLILFSVTVDSSQYCDRTWLADAPIVEALEPKAVIGEYATRWKSEWGMEHSEPVEGILELQWVDEDTWLAYYADTIRDRQLYRLIGWSDVDFDAINAWTPDDASATDLVRPGIRYIGRNTFDIGVRNSPETLSLVTSTVMIIERLDERGFFARWEVWTEPSMSFLKSGEDAGPPKGIVCAVRK